MTLFHAKEPKGQRSNLADISDTVRYFEQAIKMISDFSLWGTRNPKQNSDVFRQVY